MRWKDRLSGLAAILTAVWWLQPNLAPQSPPPTDHGRPLSFALPLKNEGHLKATDISFDCTIMNTRLEISYPSVYKVDDIPSGRVDTGVCLGVTVFPGVTVDLGNFDVDVTVQYRSGPVGLFHRSTLHRRYRGIRQEAGGFVFQERPLD